LPTTAAAGPPCLPVGSCPCGSAARLTSRQRRPLARLTSRWEVALESVTPHLPAAAALSDVEPAEDLGALDAQAGREAAGDGRLCVAAREDQRGDRRLAQHGGEELGHGEAAQARRPPAVAPHAALGEGERRVGRAEGEQQPLAGRRLGRAATAAGEPEDVEG